jgi:hypothetical protein
MAKLIRLARDKIPIERLLKQIQKTKTTGLPFDGLGKAKLQDLQECGYSTLYDFYEEWGQFRTGTLEQQQEVIRINNMYKHKRLAKNKRYPLANKLNVWYGWLQTLFEDREKAPGIFKAALMATHDDDEYADEVQRGAEEIVDAERTGDEIPLQRHRRQQTNSTTEQEGVQIIQTENAVIVDATNPDNDLEGNTQVPPPPDDHPPQFDPFPSMKEYGIKYLTSTRIKNVQLEYFNLRKPILRGKMEQDWGRVLSFDFEY